MHFLRPSQDTAVHDEYAVKSMFICNFIRYIDWSPARPEDDFVIAVLGSSEILPGLQQLASARQINSRRIIVRTVENPLEASDCSIIFVPRLAGRQLPAVIRVLGGRGILIVTEEKGMAQKGACINIVSIDGKYRFELNRMAVMRDRLRIAQQLEKLSIIIN